MKSFQYYMPTRILFGKGQLDCLSSQPLPGKKALIVTSSGSSIKKFGYLDRLEKQLDLAGIDHTLFDKILPNPIKEHVMEGASLARKESCDFIIGLGGGSSIDAAKAISIMAANPGDYWDYVGRGSGKGLPLQKNPLPVVAITTTAGTGTESDPWAVITKTETNEKIGFGCDKTFPVLSIVDPDLMMTVPPHLTAYQGFDALFHSTEGYLNNTANAMSDLYALKAIELIGHSLVAAVTDGQNAQARAEVALANTLSGIVECTSGCISEHSLEHALSAYHPKLPHGAGLIMISREYYAHFASCGACDQRMIEMARALGKQDAVTPMDFVDVLCAMQKACGVDTLKMSDYGIDGQHLEKYADNALINMANLFTKDPAPLTKEDCVEILKKSYR